MSRPHSGAPELTEAYRKARRNLVFLGAVLIFWEFVGVTVDSAGDKAITLFGIKLGFENSEAIPFVIFSVTIYLAFRCYLEWSQVSVERRAHRSAFLDMVSTALITVVAVGLFVGQSVSSARLADSISETGGMAFWSIFGLLVGASATVLLKFWNFKTISRDLHLRTAELQAELDSGVKDDYKRAAMEDILDSMNSSKVASDKDVDRYKPITALAAATLTLVSVAFTAWYLTSIPP